MKTLGIDPGKGGALALVEGGHVLAVHDMPVTTGKKGKRRIDPAALAGLVRELAPDRACIEQVGSRPGEGHAGAFDFGRSAGYVEMACAALNVPYDMVTPAVWKAAMRCPADKNAARARASQLMPDAARHWTLVKHDGRAEAALLALWLERRGAQDIEW